MKQLGERVQSLRDKKGWNQSKLAAVSGVSQSHLSDIEAGKKSARGAALSKLAEALDTTTDYLLGRVDDPTPPRLERHEAYWQGSRFGPLWETLTPEEQEEARKRIEEFEEFHLRRALREREERKRRSQDQ